MWPHAITSAQLRYEHSDGEFLMQAVDSPVLL